MARPLRIEFAGAVYHVTSRGNGYQAIFLTEEDNESFLWVLGQTVQRMGWLFQGGGQGTRKKSSKRFELRF